MVIFSTTWLWKICSTCDKCVDWNICFSLWSTCWAGQSVRTVTPYLINNLFRLYHSSHALVVLALVALTHVNFLKNRKLQHIAMGRSFMYNLSGNLLKKVVYNFWLCLQVVLASKVIISLERSLCTNLICRLQTYILITALLPSLTQAPALVGLS